MTEEQQPPRRLGGRRGARYGAVQGIYRWLMNDVDIGELLGEVSGWDHLGQADGSFLEELLRGVVAERDNLDAALDPLLDRPLAQLDPMEHGVLLVGAWELKHSLGTPARAVINEAVEMSKLFGATEAHRYINGVMDRLARQLRPQETGAGG